MAKQVNFTIADKDYILEYNRESIKTMEALGFRTNDDFLSQPIRMVETLFHGALVKNHPNITARSAGTLLTQFCEEYDSSDLVSILVDMMKGALPNASQGKGKKLLTVIE